VLLSSRRSYLFESSAVSGQSLPPFLSPREVGPLETVW